MTHENEASAYALRRAVAIEATHSGSGYCDGQHDLAAQHVDQIIPALCRVLGITEADLVAMRAQKEASASRDEADRQYREKMRELTEKMEGLHRPRPRS